MTAPLLVHPGVSRRNLLVLGGGLTLTLLGSACGAAPDYGRRKLVVVIARGAMDGLSFAPPLNEPNYAAFRGQIAIPADKTLKYDSDFGLHPKLVTLQQLAQKGQARIAPAVAIPQRIRSHFEAQDLLETGGPALYQVSTGWLNRAVQALQPGRPIKAMSVGPENPEILRGPAKTESWSPGRRDAPDTSQVVTVLQDLYAKDPLLGPALSGGMDVESMASGMGMSDTALRGRAASGLGSTAGKFLTQPGGPSIAVISLGGFDTHAHQGAVDGALAGRFEDVDQLFAGLQSGLGPAWSDTVVLMATEFGRTARMNGTLGTDHGTASTVVLAGGAIKAGGIVGDWPGLGDNRLFEGRDLAPTLDVRQVFKAVLADHMGVDRAALEATVFPGSAQAPALKGLIA